MAALMLRGRGRAARLREAERRLELALEPAIIDARRYAARRGIYAVGHELRALGLRDAIPERLRPWLNRQRDAITGSRWWPSSWRRWREPKRLARGHAQRWRTAADEASAERPDRGARHWTRLGRRRTAWHLDTISIAETARTFSEARQEYLREVSRLGGPELMLRWVAEVDACHRCLPYDGLEVPVSVGFDETPGGVHPRCRCYAVVVRP
ncbi:MAG: hypothetical protein AAF715_31970 [Myxococcota bacterium]